MASPIFTDILAKGVRAGHFPNQSKKANEWFRNTAKNYGKVNERQLLIDSKENYRKSISMGNMFMYYYSPKHAKTLPYYDRLPLVIPISPVQNGSFLGLNMHYLPLPLRAALFDALWETTNNKKYDKSTKFKATYELLKGASKYKWYKPALKRYLVSHVRSRFVYIDPADWSSALFLPTARFIGASASKVHKDSRAIIRGG